MPDADNGNTCWVTCRVKKQGYHKNDSRRSIVI
jgi:hypothetical protein